MFILIKQRDQVETTLLNAEIIAYFLFKSPLFNRNPSREFGIPISPFSPSAHEIHFQKEFFEGN